MSYLNTYQTTTLLTDTGASSIYQTGVAQTVESVLQSLVNGGNRDFGFNAQVFGGTIDGITASFEELSNGNYSLELENYNSSSAEYSKKDVFAMFDRNRYTSNSKTWKGITAEDIYDLNKDKLSYTVQSGEGLWAVVNNSGTDLTYDEILDLNPQVKERGLWAGDVLNLGLTFEEGSLVNIKEWTERDLENKSSKTDVIDE